MVSILTNCTVGQTDFYHIAPEQNTIQKDMKRNHMHIVQITGNKYLCV